MRSDTRRFILVNPGGSAENTSGVIGLVGIDNVYLTAYADYRDCPRPDALDVGQRTQAIFRLAGERGVYDIVRVS